MPLDGLVRSALQLKSFRPRAPLPLPPHRLSSLPLFFFGQGRVVPLYSPDEIFLFFLDAGRGFLHFPPARWSVSDENLCQRALFLDHFANPSHALTDCFSVRDLDRLFVWSETSPATKCLYPLFRHPRAQVVSYGKWLPHAMQSPSDWRLHRNEREIDRFLATSRYMTSLCDFRSEAVLKGSEILSKALSPSTNIFLHASAPP